MSEELQRPSFADRLEALGDRLGLLKREVVPLEGTNISLFSSIIPTWWAENGLSSSLPSWLLPTEKLSELVWVAARCIQLNAQQIAGMPLHIEGRPESDSDPLWLSNPDPNWYPNGIGDAMHAAITQMYSWGFVVIVVTSRYADGMPRTWTVLDSARVNITVENGRRKYKYAEKELNADNVVQIDRNPGVALHGTPALAAYAQQAWGLLAASNQSMTVSQGGIPLVALKSERKLTPEQALQIQTKWGEAMARRNGLPPVMDKELGFDVISFNPSDLALLDTQEWNARTIATAFGVPAPLLNMALQGGMTYQNPAALGELWWRTELRQVSTRFMNAFSTRMLPAGQWVWQEAKDTFLPLTDMSTEDDPQQSNVAKNSPSQQPLRAIGGALQ